MSICTSASQTPSRTVEMKTLLYFRDEGRIPRHKEKLMRSLIVLIPLLVLLIPPVLSQPQIDNTAVHVCTVSVIPYGYVVIGRTSTEQCRSTIDIPERDNTWIIKRPNLRETIWEKSSYPNTYAVIGRTRLSTCLNSGNETDNNAWIISRMK